MRRLTLISHVLLLCLSIFTWQAPAHAAIDAASIIVKDVNGSELWLRKGGSEKRDPLVKGTELQENDVVEVGKNSAAVLQLSDGSMVNIGPFTQYQILKPELKENFWTWSFRLIVGTVRSIVRTVTENRDFSRFRIHTETGTAGVRGTDFVVTFSGSKNRMDIYTLSGKVYVSPSGAEMSDPRTRFLEKNQTLSIDQSGFVSNAKEFRRDDFLKKLKSQGFSISEETKSSEKTNQAPTKPDSDAAKADLSKEAAEKLLLEAAALGDVRKGLQALAAKPNVEVRDEKGLTPLLLATRKRSTILMKALIDAEADPNNADPDGNTPLISAVRWGDLEGVVLLRNTAAQVGLRNKENKTALDYARERRDADISKFLELWQKETKFKGASGRTK